MEQQDLHELVEQLLDSLIPLAVKRGSFIVNDVPVSIRLYTDSNRLAHLIGELIGSCLQHQSNDCMTLSAKLFSSVILLHIKLNKPIQSAVFFNRLEELEPLAEEMGGCISIQPQHSGEGVNITLSFLKAKKLCLRSSLATPA